jgi:hypothetical protein
MAKLASWLTLLVFTLFCVMGCSVKTFESKESLMVAIENILINKGKARLIPCPEDSYKPDVKAAIKKCFAQSVELREFLDLINSEMTQFSTKIRGWRTDNNVTGADFVTNDQKYSVGFTYVPRSGSQRENYAPLESDFVFLSVIAGENEFRTK